MTKLEDFKNYQINRKKSHVYYQTLLPFFKWLAGRKITKTLITEYITRFKSENTINILIASGRAFYKWQDKTNSVFHNFETVTVPKKQVEYITVQEKDEIISKLTSEQEKAIVEILFKTGLRKMELCNLRSENVDMAKNYLLITETKGKEDRIVNFPDSLKPYLHTYFSKTVDKGFMNRLSLKIKKITGRQNLNIHSFRHSFCHWMSERIPLPILKKQTGHSSVAILMRYAEADRKQIDRVMEEAFKKEEDLVKF